MHLLNIDKLRVEILFIRDLLTEIKSEKRLPSNRIVIPVGLCLRKFTPIDRNIQAFLVSFGLLIKNNLLHWKYETLTIFRNSQKARVSP